MTKKKTKTKTKRSVVVKKEVMTPKHKSWEDFMTLLEGPMGCNFKRDEKGEITWKCDNDYTHTERLLKEHYPNVDLESTLTYFEAHGGYCDCEILFNVDDSERDA